MQPYFLPYPGYFALVRRSDVWVVFDDAQMIRHGWVDRNRVLHPTEGWMYLKVPTRKHSRGTPIRDVRVSSGSDWSARILRQLGHYRRAPHYADVVGLLEEAFETAPETMDAVCVHLLERICRYLGLEFHPLLHSRLEYDRSQVGGPGDWALVVARELGASAYLNQPGGRDIFDPAAFARAGVELRIVEWRPTPYPQLREPFEPNLSIVDMLMFLDPSEVRTRLDDVEVEVPGGPAHRGDPEDPR